MRLTGYIMRRTADSFCCSMRSSMVSALWARALLAMLVALDFVVHAVCTPCGDAVMIEDCSNYQSCISNPSDCTVMCAARLPPTLSLGRNRTQECVTMRRCETRLVLVRAGS